MFQIWDNASLWMIIVSVIWWNTAVDTAMRRPARVITWKSSITPLLLLSSMLFNSAAAARAGNNTNYHGVPPLLAIIASLRHRHDAVQPSKVMVKSPPRLAELAPLLVSETLRSAKLSKTPLSRSRLFLDKHESQAEAGLSPPTASSRHRGFFSRVGTVATN